MAAIGKTSRNQSPWPMQTATMVAPAPISAATVSWEDAIAPVASERCLPGANTSYAAIATTSPMPASQSRAMTACCAVQTNYAPRWAANPAVQIGSHISPRACGNKHTKESVLKLSGARTKQTNCFSATLPTFSARRNVRYSLQNSEIAKLWIRPEHWGENDRVLIASIAISGSNERSRNS